MLARRLRIRGWGTAPAVLLALSTAVSAAAGGLGACDPDGAAGAGASASTGGEGGCPTQPQAMLTITVRAAEGPVPPDTTVQVTWSAAKEPPFVLSDPATWKTLEDANIVCDVARGEPPPTDLQALSCQLWTSGPTHVEITAKGYNDYDETLSPTQSDLCEGPVPTAVDITLERATDGGTE